MKWDESNKGNIIRNGQTLLLTTALSNWTDATRPLRADAPLLEEAKKHLLSLPLFGLVERFDESARRFGNWLEPVFPGINFFPVRLNSQAERHADLGERLVAIEVELGAALHRDLLEANKFDLELYRFATAQFDKV